MSNLDRRGIRAKRKRRIRKKITGSLERPRLSLFRSDRHVYAQVIDDTVGNTIASVHSFSKGEGKRASIEVCKELGKKLAERCKEKKVAQVVFDKNGYSYHGRIKAFAEGAREGGLQF
jgi:large subunit ribosomal protein L18